MKIYYANIIGCKVLETFLGSKKINVLSSFYGAPLPKEKPPYCDGVFIDSGAFSAFRKKIVINVQDYILFLKKQTLSTTYASLDVIGDAKESLRLFQIMKKQGLEPIPCFHIGESIKYLDFYSQQCSYIALGGVAMKRKVERSLWLDLVFERIWDLCLSKKVKVHGFGIFDENTIFRYPWESVDASSIHVIARYGGIYTPFGVSLKINPNVNEGDRKWQDSPVSISTIKSWVKSIGFDFEKARSGTPEATLLRTAISIRYFEDVLKKEAKIVKRRPKTGLKINW